MREKLARIRSPWRRLLITILINSMLLVSSFKPRRARVHWIGHNNHSRPRRYERALSFFLLFGGMLFLEPREYILWVTLWGGGLAIFINLQVIYLLIPHVRINK